MFGMLQAEAPPTLTLTPPLQPPEGKLGRLPDASTLAMTAAYAASKAKPSEVAGWFNRYSTSAAGKIKPLLHRFSWLGEAAVRHVGVSQDSLEERIHIE